MTSRRTPDGSGGLTPAVIRRITSTELRRRLRSVLGNRTKILLYVFVLLVGFGPMILFGSLLLTLAGESIATGEIDSTTLEGASDLGSGGVAVSLVGLTGMAAIRTFTTVADLDEPATLLLSTALPNVVIGVLGTELVSFLLWLGPPTLVLAGAFAYGLGSPLPVGTALVTVALLLVLAIPAGFVVGVCVRHLLTVYEPVARYRTLIGLAVGGLYFGSIAFGWFGEVTARLFFALADSPLGWPGHLLVAGVPSVPFSPLLAVGGVLGPLVAVPVVLVGAVRVADFHWYADPAQRDDEADAVESETRFAALVGGVGGPVGTVAVTTLRRAKRSPIRLLYVAYPVLMSLFFAEQVVQTGTLPVSGAVALSLYVVWGTGALFTLNVLGDRGPAMEAELLSTIAGRDVVAGTTLAGLLVGVPVALVVAPLAGLASPLSIQQTAVLTGGTLGGVLAAPLLATGIGTLFPRFGSVRVVNNREAVMPSKTAFLLYTLAIALPALAATVLTVGAEQTVAGLLSLVLSLLPGVDFAVGESVVTAVAWTVLVAGLLAPGLSAVYAARTFDTYLPY